MIHYHGGPMWGNVDIGPKIIWCGDVLYRNSCALVSYARPEQIKKIAPICKSLMLDNGAFTFYMRGVEANDEHWNSYYDLVREWFDKIDSFIIPDVIGGSEIDNDKLLINVPSDLSTKGIPVWHSNESIDRLLMLALSFKKIAIGLIKEHKPATSNKAALILNKVFDTLYIEHQIDVKVHGLAMMDGRIVGKYPFDSVDSAFVSVNVPKTKSQMKDVQCKLARTAIYKNKIEIVKPPDINDYILDRLNLL